MKELIKTMLGLALVFASTFLLLKLTGVLSLEDVRGALDAARESSPPHLALLVVLVLYADLFIAVPTMTVALLAGFVLGWPLGGAATLSGLFLAGTTGYWLSRRFGTAVLRRIYGDEEKLAEIERAFERSGPWLLISCRALPILPEVSCCLAGATHMPFKRFMPLFALGTVPYALIVTYAGSISTLERPQPAILTAIVVSMLLWASWYRLVRRPRGR